MDKKQFDEMSNDLKEKYTKFMRRDIMAEDQMSLALELSQFVEFNDNFKNASLQNVTRGIANFTSSYITSRPDFNKMSDKAKAAIIGEYMNTILTMFAVSGMVDNLTKKFKGKL